MGEGGLLEETCVIEADAHKLLGGVGGEFITGDCLGFAPENNPVAAQWTKIQFQNKERIKIDGWGNEHICDLWQEKAPTTIKSSLKTQLTAFSMLIL